MKFQRKNIIIDAVQWFKLGDHPVVTKYSLENEPEKVVGWINTIDGGNIVHSGDWIIRHNDGKFSSCNSEKFHQNYSHVE